MRRAFPFLSSIAAIVVTAALLAGTTLGASSSRTLAQAQAAGWDCNPMILIGGHFHCSPPGGPSVQDIIDGTATTPRTSIRSTGRTASSRGARR